MPTRHFIISGKVQGVYFRVYTKECADALGLNGWTRNRSEGTVEAVVSGTTEQLDEMRTRLNKGSPASRVDGIEETDWSETPPQGFEIRETL